MIERIIQGDALEQLKTLEDNSIDCCVTSPPYYGLRDYGTGEMQIGPEETPEEFINKLVEVFEEVRRVLKDDGTLWLNIGDSYAGSGKGRNKDGSSRGSITGSLLKSGNGEAKPKDLIGIPWMLAFALRSKGWYLRQDIIWHKPNPMPESVKDRCTKSHEYIFLLSKKPNYYFDYKAIQEEAKWKEDKRATGERIEYDGKRAEGKDRKAQKDFCAFSHKNLQYKGQQNHSFHERRAEGMSDETYIVRNKRDVWSVTTKAVKEAHFATFPEDLIEPCIKAGCPVGGVVLDPFFGSGTTGRVATRLQRGYVGIELNPEYIEICNKRLNDVQIEMV